MVRTEYTINVFAGCDLNPLIQDASFEVTHWVPDELFGNYPEGARWKSAIFPPPAFHSPLIVPGHRYLFKRSKKSYPDQFWAEVIAYLVGCALGVTVPPAFVAYDAESDSCGALIEWFYVDGEASLISGGNYMQAIDKNYDRKRGEMHNFVYVGAWSRAMAVNRQSNDNWQQYWANAFLFDALIGNTDRHQDNWGYLRKHGVDGPALELSPLFDNGTSLGHERFTDRIAAWRDEDFDRYISKGTHHMKWQPNDAGPCGHFEMIRMIIQRYPVVRDNLQVMINSFIIDDLRVQLRHLETIALPIPLTRARSDFCLRLLELRKEKILLAVQ